MSQNFSANKGSGNAVQWLLQKSKEGAVSAEGQSQSKQGALEWFKNQKNPSSDGATAGPVSKPQDKPKESKHDKPPKVATPEPHANHDAGTKVQAQSQGALPLPRSQRKEKRPNAKAQHPEGSSALPVPRTKATTPPLGPASSRPLPPTYTPPSMTPSAPPAAPPPIQLTPGDELRNQVATLVRQQESVSLSTVLQRAKQQQRLDMNAILSVINDHDVTFVCTDTGTGKTTAIPNALLNASDSNRLVATQPRRTAAIAAASYVSQLRSTPVGDEVGYWIRGDKKGDMETTRLWYMTSYTLLLRLLSYPIDELPFTHVILDEFHERQPDIEVTIALLRLCVKQRNAMVKDGKESKNKGLKIIVMSATLDMKEWEGFFGEDVSVAVYRQSEPEHPIHDFVLEDACALTNLAVPPHALMSFLPTTVDNQQADSVMFVAQHLIAFLTQISTSVEQSILVFLPGRSQVEQFVYWTNQMFARRLEPIPWHSSVDLQTIEQAIHRRATVRQKLYLATDIAEVSITIPDVVFVIDVGLVKRPQIAYSIQPASVMYPPLVTQFISRGSVDQRRGRVGRTQQGFYFSLLSSQQLKLLPAFPAPPIEHSRIDELALHVLQLASNPVAMFSICRGQPSFEAITSSMRCLCDLGCIVPEKAEGGEAVPEMQQASEMWSPIIIDEAKRSMAAEGVTIQEFSTTFIGRILQRIPVSVHQGMLVFYGLLLGIESLGILAAACCNCQNPFIVDVFAPQQQQGGGRGRRPKASGESIGRAMEATETSMKSFSGAIPSDIAASMGACLAYLDWLHQHHGQVSESQCRDWCARHNLAFDRLTAIVDLDQHIKFELSDIVPFRDIPEPAVLREQHKAFAPVLEVMICAAFASQALEVTAEGAAQFKTREGAVGIFGDLKAMPDLHNPSCMRWTIGEVVVPVAVSLRFSHMLCSYTTHISGLKAFYTNILLLAHHLKYAAFQDDEGAYYTFEVTYNGVTRYIELDHQTGQAVLEFRQRLSRLAKALRQRYSHKELSEEEFDAKILVGQPGFGLQQREVLAALVHYFLNPKVMEERNVVEVAEAGDTLDAESMISFALEEAATA